MSGEHQREQDATPARGTDVDRARRRVRCSRADVQLIGRVGCDPDIRFPSEGSDRVWARFTVATDSRYDDDDRPDWHTVIVRDRLAQFVARYLTRGRLVHVTGCLSYRRIEGEIGRTASPRSMPQTYLSWIGNCGRTTRLHLPEGG